MAGDWRAGDVVRLAGEGYEDHVVARMVGNVVNPWVALTWDPEDGDAFLTDEEVDQLSPTLVYRAPPVTG